MRDSRTYSKKCDKYVSGIGNMILSLTLFKSFELKGFGNVFHGRREHLLFTVYFGSRKGTNLGFIMNLIKQIVTKCHGDSTTVTLNNKETHTTESVK